MRLSNCTAKVQSLGSKRRYRKCPTETTRQAALDWLGDTSRRCSSREPLPEPPLSMSRRFSNEKQSRTDVSRSSLCWLRAQESRQSQLRQGGQTTPPTFCQHLKGPYLPSHSMALATDASPAMMRRSRDCPASPLRKLWTHTSQLLQTMSEQENLLP